MAMDRSLAFDTEKCDVEAVERIPPCEVLISDLTVPDAPPTITDCVTPQIESFPADPPCPDISPSTTQTVALDSDFLTQSQAQYGYTRPDDSNCAYDFSLTVNVNPETSPVLVVSSNPVGSRYLGVRQLENGLPDTWTSAQAVWVYNLRSNGLAAGQIYLVRWNPVNDKFVGLRQGWTVDCCSDLLPPEGGCCDEPDPMCLTIESNDCPQIHGMRASKNQSGFFQLCGCFANVTVALVCTDPDLGAEGYVLAIVGFPNPGGDCNITSLAFSNSELVSANCDPFEIVFTVDITTVVVAPPTCVGTATFTFTADTGCACSGSSGSDMVSVTCEPGAVPVIMTGIFAATSGSNCDGDGESFVIQYYTFSGDTWYWLGSGTLAGVDFLFHIDCTPDGWSVRFCLLDTNGNETTCFDGTAGESSPGVWTFFVGGIDVGDGCIYSVAASFSF